MASPCACGGLALLLSALKAEGQAVTPARIRCTAALLLSLLVLSCRISNYCHILPSQLPCRPSCIHCLHVCQLHSLLNLHLSPAPIPAGAPWRTPACQWLRTPQTACSLTAEACSRWVDGSLAGLTAAVHVFGMTQHCRVAAGGTGRESRPAPRPTALCCPYRSRWMLPTGISSAQQTGTCRQVSSPSTRYTARLCKCLPACCQRHFASYQNASVPSSKTLQFSSQLFKPFVGAHMPTHPPPIPPTPVWLLRCRPAVRGDGAAQRQQRHPARHLPAGPTGRAPPHDLPVSD